MTDYYCFKCQESFSRMLHVKIHLQNVHFVRETTEKEIKCVKSRNCLQYFNTFRDMMYHSSKCRLVESQSEDDNDDNILMCDNLTTTTNSSEEDNNEMTPTRIEVPEDHPDNTVIVCEEIPRPENDENIENHNRSSRDIWSSMKNMIDTLLKLLTSHQIPKSITKDIFRQLETVFASLNELLDSFLKSNVASSYNTIIKEFVDLFFANVSNIIQKYRSEYLIQKEIESHESYVKPISRSIGGKFKIYCWFNSKFLINSRKLG